MTASAFVSWNVRTIPRRAIVCGGPPVIGVAVEADVAAVGALETRHDVEQRRLARAVRADERGDRASSDVEGRSVDRVQACRSCLRTPRTSRSGASAAGTEYQLLALAEQPLGPEGDERHQDAPDDHEAERRHLRVRKRQLEIARRLEQERRKNDPTTTPR